MTANSATPDLTLSDLTLSGTIPGLLRRGSPVVVSGDEAGGWYYPAVVVELGQVDEQGEMWTITASSVHAWANGRQAQDRLALDLTDKTGLLHAALWLAQRWISCINDEEFMQLAASKGVPYELVEVIHALVLSETDNLVTEETS